MLTPPLNCHKHTGLSPTGGSTQTLICARRRPGRGTAAVFSQFAPLVMAMLRPSADGCLYTWFSAHYAFAGFAQACLLLEAALNPLFVRGGGLAEALLPPPASALRAPTPAAVCFRVWVLDRSLLYGGAVVVDAPARATRKATGGGNEPAAATEAEAVMGIGTRRVGRRPPAKKKAIANQDKAWQ